MDLASLEPDQLDLGCGDGPRNHGDEAQAEHPREIGFRYRRRAARCFDDRRVRTDPVVAQAVEEQGARQPVLQASRWMAGFVLEVETDVRTGQEAVQDEMRVGGPVVVRLDPLDGLIVPRPSRGNSSGWRPWPFVALVVTSSRSTHCLALPPCMKSGLQEDNRGSTGADGSSSGTDCRLPGPDSNRRPFD